ncbi:hypothetical protein NBT05_11005 [Aquimarina sp. ERC-38]|uniref:hypothetical protein n=1 Tax=Aquimarina sp. ERC-38 TaxID=2949996 RepID=UPI002247FA61|nr:hypothetical protein [Aquimarina sp. ERC-38]UZO79488.1 hypothetical protein NBT05_11005 [Aquimarina sp. ERC-38]
MIKVDDWQIKVYTIAKKGEFDHPEFYNNVITQLPQWLQLENSFKASNDKIAFLILHSGTEGIFSLINWWVDKYMLNTNIFITHPSKPDKFNKISGDGLAPCIWELEVINHERISWTNHVIKKMPEPQYDEYLKDTISLEI